MLIKESQLIPNTKELDILEQLDQAVYLTQEETSLHMEEIPVVVKEDGKNLVDYDYLDRVANQNGCSIFEAAKMVQESNTLDSLTISVNEEYAIVMQEEFDPSTMVIKPLSEDSDELFWANYVCEQYMSYKIDDDLLTEALMSIDEATVEELKKKHIDNAYAKFHDNMVDADEKKIDAKDKLFGRNISDKKRKRLEKEISNQFNNTYNSEIDKYNKKKNKISAAADRLQRIRDAKESREAKEKEHQQNNLPAVKPTSQITTTTKPNSSGEVTNVTPKKEEPKAAGSAITTVPEAPKVDVEALKDQPKSVIGKKVAALRNIYSKFMQKAESSTDTGIKARIKKVAAKILSIIDKLLAFLQKKAG